MFAHTRIPASPQEISAALQCPLLEIRHPLSGYRVWGEDCVASSYPTLDLHAGVCRPAILPE